MSNEKKNREGQRWPLPERIKKNTRRSGQKQGGEALKKKKAIETAVIAEALLTGKIGHSERKGQKGQKARQNPKHPQGGIVPDNSRKEPGRKDLPGIRKEQGGRALQVAKSISGEKIRPDTRSPQKSKAVLQEDKNPKAHKKGKSGKGRGGKNGAGNQKNRGSVLPYIEVEKPLPFTYRGSKKGKKSGEKLKIIPLGGLEQIGLNITAFEYGESIVVVDCGLSFPEDDMLGIDLVIPDISYLKENRSKVKGFVITHGHEDHIGALPYVLRELNVPIYSTRLTLALIANKLREHDLVRTTKLKEVRHGQVINLGDFAIEFIKTNHSIQDASALAIYSPVGIVVHTGDFKVDYTPVFGDAIDLQRFAEIGKKGVLALMCDSTNAERAGFTMSERTVGKVFDNLFNEHRSSRIIIATFASNVDRVQQIINTAYRYGRKVALEGRSMVNVISTAAELDYLRIPDQTLMDLDQIKNYPDEKVVLITTGSQGESMAALSRMAADIHKKVTIKPNDTIIFSSNPIPGNEKAVSKVINELSMKGAKVIFQDAHVSGHACQEEIKLLYSLVRPRYAIPVHGEYRHLTAQANLVEELGIPKENVFILSSGNVLELDAETAAVTGSVQTGTILVDGLGVGDVGNAVLRDRQHLAEDGIIIIVMALDRLSNQVLSGPDIVSRGFVYVKESEDLMEHARETVEKALDGCMDRGVTDWSKIKTEVKEALSGYVWKRTKRSPMILPIIMEA